MKIGDMPRVQNVKTTVGDHENAPLFAETYPPFRQLLDSDYLFQQ